MRRIGLCAVIWGTMCLLVGNGWAFDKPECICGPLRMALSGPDRITERHAPVEVTLENIGGAPLAGTAALQGIDDWRITPAARLDFQLAPGAQTTLHFVAEAGPAVFNALYPLHARAEFAANGISDTAHAVLILETMLADPPQAVHPALWTPVSVAPDTEMPLWRSPAHRSFLALFDEAAPRLLPPGWKGNEGDTRASLTFGDAVDRSGVRESISVHPPWYQGRSGSIITEFPIILPATPAARFFMGLSLRDHLAAQGEPASDGITFRVRAIESSAPEGAVGTVILEQHVTAKTWQDYEVDLSPYAGRSLRLQLETHPGPQKDTTCDRGLWGAPRIVCGTPPAARVFPPTETSTATKLGDAGGYSVHMLPGVRGLLDAVFWFENRNVPKAVRLFIDGFRVQVRGDALHEASSFHALRRVVEETAADGHARWRHCFEGALGAFDLLGELWVEEGAFRAALWLENTPQPTPWNVTRIEDAALGRWSEKALRVYAGVGNVLEMPGSFILGFDGHQLATSYVGCDFINGMAVVQGVDTAPMNFEVAPEEFRYTLHAAHRQTWTVAPAPNVWDAVKVWRALDKRQAGSGVAQLAGRFVFDLWGGTYEESAGALRRAFQYGLTDALCVWHNWQRWGYDYRLPDIYPPNPHLGTLEEFQGLADTCRQHGVLFAPHDNYIDFYPDAEQFSYRHIAFTENREPIRAWLNEGRRAQSFRWRPDAIGPFVHRNLALIREAVRPSAFFIDVFSSIRPHDYWTDTGAFYDTAYTRDAWGEIFAWIRDYLGASAPQISESGHDQLIGWLDGAQANHLRVDPGVQGQDSWFTWRVSCANAERIPWMDAAYHDRFVLHGAGYDPRYRAALDPLYHGIYSDDYIATEVLTGHPAMVPAPFGRNVVRKYWLLHDLGRALALKQMETVVFAGNDPHRQYVRWQDGGEVWVNRGDEDWTLDMARLPQYGYFAQIPDAKLASSIEYRQGVIVEWSKSPDTWFVNARLPENRPPAVSGAMEEVRFLEGHTIEAVLRWNATRPLETDQTIFLHAIDGQGKICFQGDHRPPQPTSQWQGLIRTTARMTAPADTVPGSRFRIVTGLYDTQTHRRAPLQGYDAAKQFLYLGDIIWTGGEGRITGATWKPAESAPPVSNPRENEKAIAVDFGGVQTAGACRLGVMDKNLVITPLPGGQPFEVVLDWEKLPWPLPKPTVAEALDDAGHAVVSAALEWKGTNVAVICEPGVFQYFLR